MSKLDDFREREATSVNNQEETSVSTADVTSLHFKPEVDFSCLGELYQIVREKQLMEKRTVALDHALFLLGSINAWMARDKTEENVYAAMAIPNELEGEGALFDTLGNQIDTESKMNPFFAAILKKFLQALLDQLL